MLTPIDIEKKDFKKSFFGYNRKNVEEFLFQVSDECEELIRESEFNQKEIHRLKDELDKFNRIEKNLSEALVVAKQTAAEIIKNAEKEAELIIRKSEEEAKHIIDEANEEVIEARKTFNDLRKEMAIYKSKMESMIKSQLEINKQIDID